MYILLLYIFNVPTDICRCYVNFKCSGGRSITPLCTWIMEYIWRGQLQIWSWVFELVLNYNLKWCSSSSYYFLFILTISCVLKNNTKKMWDAWSSVRNFKFTRRTSLAQLHKEQNLREKRGSGNRMRAESKPAKSAWKGPRETERVTKLVTTKKLFLAEQTRLSGSWSSVMLLPSLMVHAAAVASEACRQKSLLQLEPEMCTNVCCTASLISVSYTTTRSELHRDVPSRLSVCYLLSADIARSFISLLFNNKVLLISRLSNILHSSISKCLSAYNLFFDWTCSWTWVMHFLKWIRDNVVPQECNTSWICRLRLMKVKRLSNNKWGYCWRRLGAVGWPLGDRGNIALTDMEIESKWPRSKALRGLTTQSLSIPGD